MVFAVEETGVTSTFAGFVKMEFAKLWISFGMVAEKNKVWRCTGNFAITFFTSFTKPMSSIRSASSNTKICMDRKST